MSGRQDLERFLETDRRDVGCDEALRLLDLPGAARAGGKEQAGIGTIQPEEAARTVFRPQLSEP